MAKRSFFRELFQIYTSIFVVGLILVFGLLADISKTLFRVPVRMVRRVRSG